MNCLLLCIAYDSIVIKTNAFLATGYYLSNAIRRLWNLIFAGGNFRIHFRPSSRFDCRQESCGLEYLIDWNLSPTVLEHF